MVARQFGDQWNISGLHLSSNRILDTLADIIVLLL